MEFHGTAQPRDLTSITSLPVGWGISTNLTDLDIYPGRVSLVSILALMPSQSYLLYNQLPVHCTGNLSKLLHWSISRCYTNSL